MRILVLSDSHGDRWAVERAVRAQPSAELILFLGDGVEEAEQVCRRLPENRLLRAVRGNNDWCCSAPDFDELTLEGKKIFFTHGHLYQVKYGLSRLTAAAAAHGADIALFGHTHEPMTAYDHGLTLMNPGALAFARGGRPGYGFIDLTPAGVVTQTVTL